MKNKKVSALLSLLFPGLGQFYIGQCVDGMILLIGAGVLWYALFVRSYYLLTFESPRAFLVWGALISIYIYSVIDSYRKA